MWHTRQQFCIYLKTVRFVPVPLILNHAVVGYVPNPNPNPNPVGFSDYDYDYEQTPTHAPTHSLTHSVNFQNQQCRFRICRGRRMLPAALNHFSQ